MRFAAFSLGARCDRRRSRRGMESRLLHSGRGTEGRLTESGMLQSRRGMESLHGFCSFLVESTLGTPLEPPTDGKRDAAEQAGDKEPA
jgi:hypothetical protein